MEVTKFIDIANAPEATDEELFVQFHKSRKREVLAILFRRHMALVFGLCKKHLLEKHAAQDATMEIFERLYSAEPKEEIQNFRAYLYVMSRNYCLMKLRGERHFFLDISKADMESAFEMHPIDQTESKLTALEKCMKELKELQFECVDRFYMKNMSYLQISDQLKIAIGAVKSHIQNGKRNLKVCIEAAA